MINRLKINSNNIYNWIVLIMSFYIGMYIIERVIDLSLKILKLLSFFNPPNWVVNVLDEISLVDFYSSRGIL